MRSCPRRSSAGWAVEVSKDWCRIQEDRGSDGSGAEQALYAENPRELWRASLVTAHFGACADAKGVVAAAASLAGLVSCPTGDGSAGPRMYLLYGHQL